MKKRTLLSVSGCLAVFALQAQVTLDFCLQKADENYPLIKRYALVDKTETITLSDINKQWLPSVTAYAQGNIQNHIAEFPSALTDVMVQMGRNMRGLSKFQYKVGVDVNQTIWDGGTSKAKRTTAKANSEETTASLDVKMYAMHEKVISIFFAALLTEQQIMQQETTISLLESNLEKVEAMLRDGTAMRSDADNVKAQLLTSRQKLIEAQQALHSYKELLSLYVGESLEEKSLEKPSASLPYDLVSQRPELRLFDAQKRVNNAKTAEIYASLMPKVGLFAQSFYGYPGFNNFEAMMNRKLSFNILAGVKASWSLSPLYTKKNSLKKIGIANDAIETEIETFLFNSRLQTRSNMEEIEGLRKVMADDGEIIQLREAVRKAAEVQLDNGVIDTFTLLSKITDENQARLSAAYHEIQLLKAIQQLKYTLNK